MVDTHLPTPNWLTLTQSALEQLDRELADLEATAETLRQELVRPLPEVRLPMGNGQMLNSQSTGIQPMPLIGPLSGGVPSPASEPQVIAPPTIVGVTGNGPVLNPHSTRAQPMLVTAVTITAPPDPETNAGKSPELAASFDEHSSELPAGDEPTALEVSAALTTPHRVRKPATRLAAWTGTN